MTAQAYVGVLTGLTVTIIIALLAQWTWPNYLELKLFDIRQKLFPVPDSNADIATIVIDDNSLEQIGRWPWPRKNIAQLITLCQQAGARQVVLDILMPEEQHKELSLPGTTDVSVFEPPVEFITTPEPFTIDNDAILENALAQSSIVTLPFHAHLYENSAEQSGTENDDLYNQAYNFLKQSGNLDTIDFKADVLPHIWPDRDPNLRDENYFDLLRTYIRALAMIRLEKFSRPFDPDKTSVNIYRLANFTPPFPTFIRPLTHSSYVSAQDDSDGVVRRVPLVAQYQGRLYTQLAFGAACCQLDVKLQDIDITRPDKISMPSRKLSIPLDAKGRMLIAWTQNWQQDRGYISATRLASIWEKQNALGQNQTKLRLIDDLTFQLGSIPEDTSAFDKATLDIIAQKQQQLALLPDPQILRQSIAELQQEISQAQQQLKVELNGKIVLVGSTATAAADFVVTPFSKLTPGIVVHRNILNTILQGAFIHRPARWLELLAICLLGLTMTTVTALYRPLVSGLLLTLLCWAVIIINFYLIFAQGHYWFALVSPLAVILATFTAVTFYREITEGKAKRQITTRFKQYTSPALVDRIVESGSTLSFAGEMRPLSCFFSDLAGFTTISERLGPHETVSILNLYLDRMTEVLDRYYATINKFEGDGIFAFFGAPVEIPDFPLQACRAALAAQTELQKLIQQQQQIKADFPTLKMRIGIATGDVVVGDCGSHRKFDYTAIGDNVNLASRLEGANKAFGTQIMICENTYNLACSAVEARYLGKVRVLGKKIGVGIYECLTEKDRLRPEQEQYNEMFAQAVRSFQQTEFRLAVEQFEKCLEIHPDDQAAKLYYQTTQKFLAAGAPENFNGCIEMTGK